MKLFKLLESLRSEYKDVDAFSHVDINPSTDKIDWDSLTSQEIAALQSVGVEVPEDEYIPKSDRLPPAQAPNGAPEDDSYEAGIPGEPDYRNRLRGNSPHIDKIAGTHEEMKAKAEEEALKSANSKIKSSEQRRRDELDEARAKRNYEVNQLAYQNWAVATA